MATIKKQTRKPAKPAISTPDYKKIYTDMILLKYPEKADICSEILSKKNLSVMDLINLNKYLSESKSTRYNQMLKAYDREAIFEILENQKKNRLNNKQTAEKFCISRNTITRWKKIYISVERFPEK